MEGPENRADPGGAAGTGTTASFYPTLGEGRATGTQPATEQMALTIVQELQADW